MVFKPTDYLPYDFANRRHIGPSPAEMAEMLKVVGAGSLDALIDDTVPAAIRQKEPLDFGKAMSERELLEHMRVTAAQEQGADLADRAGLSRHGDAARDPAQHSGKPGLVHGLYALSAGDRARPA